MWVLCKVFALPLRAVSSIALTSCRMNRSRSRQFMDLCTKKSLFAERKFIENAHLSALFTCWNGAVMTFFALHHVSFQEAYVHSQIQSWKTNCSPIIPSLGTYKWSFRLSMICPNLRSDQLFYRPTAKHDYARDGTCSQSRTTAASRSGEVM